MLSLFSLEFSHPAFLIISILCAIIITYISFFKNIGQFSIILGVKKRRFFNRHDLFLIIISIIQLVGLLFISISAGSPIQTKKQSVENRDVRDIYFVVDVSRSMLADDFSPNRLEVAKKYIKDFIEYRGNDRIGINIFAEKIITLSPLTYDQIALKDKVGDISVGFLGNGTNIGDAIALAVARLEKSEAKSKIIILLTDGVSNAGSISPRHAGNIAKEKMIKIYGIGIGTTGDAYIPYRVGSRTMRQRIPGGNIDHGLLDEISKNTNGKYYKATSDASLRKIFNQINELEKTNIEIKSPTLVKYNYKRYLLFGLFLFLFSEVIRRFLIRFTF